MQVSSRAPVSAKEIRLGVAQQDSYFLLRTLLSAWTDICTHMCSYTTQCTFKNRPHVFSTFFLRLCYFMNICVPECKSLPRVCSTAGGQERAQDPRDHVSQLTAAGNQTKALWGAASILTQRPLSSLGLYTFLTFVRGEICCYVESQLLMWSCFYVILYVLNSTLYFDIYS